MSFDLVDLKVNDPLRQRGVLYIGQYGTSGYATAAKGYICDFIMRGVPISGYPLKFDDSDLGDDCYYNMMAKTVIDKNVPNVQTAILHCTADLWPKYRKDNAKLFDHRNIIGYTVWESSKLPESWADHINSSVNEVWCPSKYNAETFRNSGVKVSIRVVPHIFLKKTLPERHHISLASCSGGIAYDNDLYTFYNISELNERKNVKELVEAFCKAFTKEDKVRLVLKTHYKDYSLPNVKFCMSYVSSILSKYPDHAPVFLLVGNMTTTELDSVHSIGDCYVTLTRSEAFGLTIFDAFHYNKKIIATNYSGYLDFLGADYPGLVSCELGPIKNMENFTHGYYMSGEQEWAYPNMDHAVDLMRDAFENQ